MQAYNAYHIYSLPRELLDTLTVRTVLLQAPPSTTTKPRAPVPGETKQRPPQDGIDAANRLGTNINARACNICLGVAFLDVDEQRTHFRSDWHRYNVKTRLNGGQPVSEDRFAELVEALDDSLSGSASSSEDNDSEGNSTDAVLSLIKKTKQLNLNIQSDEEDHRKRPPQSPLVWFHSPQHQTQLGIYKAIFSNLLDDISDTNKYLHALQGMQHTVDMPRTWAVFMVAGGHFAGAIVRVAKLDIERLEDREAAAGKKKKQKPKPEMEVLKHKTFHRYTTRKKQGGSQSMNDNAKGPAKSAGALLRRYGEQALRDDIHNLLLDWADDIHQCERIWIRASASNRRIFLDFEEGPLTKSDPRLRTFPFPTRRPTQSELARCLLELTRPKVSHLTEEQLKAQDEAFLASIKPKAPPKPPPQVHQTVPNALARPKLTKDEEQLKEKWLRALDMISRNRLETLKGFWEKEGMAMGGVDAAIPDYVGVGGRVGTILQAAAAVGSEDVVRWLLEEVNADPTVPVPKRGEESGKGETEDKDGKREEGEDGDDEDRVPLKPGARRTAYDLAKTKAVRDIFRRSAAASPDKWDWFGAGRVPSGLSKEMEEEREEKKKVRRKGLKDKVKEREREAAAKRALSEPLEPEPEPEPRTNARENGKVDLTGPRRLGGNAGAGDAVAGLTPEMRAKVERERRARAAEARLMGLVKK